MPDPLLSVSHLYAGYGDLIVVRDVSFDVERGSVTLMLGLNGAGKTTTLKTIMGVLPAKGGRIVFEGRDVTRLPPHERARLGMAMITDNPVFPDMSVADNIRLAAEASGRRAGGDPVSEAVKYFPDLGRFLGVKASALSGGQRKMLAVAMAMVSRPKLLLLDEPSTGLSPVMVSRVVDYVAQLKSMGITVLLAEQNPSFIAVADYVVVLEMGKVRLAGPAGEVGRLEEVRKSFFQVA